MLSPESVAATDMTFGLVKLRDKKVLHHYCRRRCLPSTPPQSRGVYRVFQRLAVTAPQLLLIICAPLAVAYNIADTASAVVPEPFIPKTSTALFCCPHDASYSNSVISSAAMVPATWCRDRYNQQGHCHYQNNPSRDVIDIPCRRYRCRPYN
jgi:hypothetical protein